MCKGMERRSFPKERPNKAGLSEPERMFSVESHVFSVGARVQIVSYSPFRGLRGTIQTAHCLPPREEPLYFYYITLDGIYLKEAIWFSSEEVELLSSQENFPLEGSRRRAR